MKQFKKKLKGMTLVEVVIAIAVFAIMGALLVTAANLINVHLKSTNQLNAKVAEQGPIAEAQYNGAAYPVAGGTTQIEVKYGGSKETLRISYQNLAFLLFSLLYGIFLL